VKAAVLLVDTGTGPRRVRLADYLDGPREEQATRAAHDWIKRLRHVKVEEQPLRRRFRYRGDSLWWFAELYLHKRQVILDLFRILLALEHLFDCERPLEIKVASGGPLVRGMVGALGLPGWLNGILVGEFGVLTMTVTYLLGILLDPDNAGQALPLVFTGPSESAAYFAQLDRFIARTRNPT